MHAVLSIVDEFLFSTTAAAAIAKRSSVAD
jgi:hypothetical protein